MGITTDVRHPVRLATFAMGTRFEFVLVGDDDLLLRAAGEEAICAIEDAHARLNRFEPGGPIYEMNARAGIASVRVDDELFALFKRCERARRKSACGFDVVRRAKNGCATNTESRTSEPLLGMDRDRRTIGLLFDGTMIDLGGVAKGFALDLAAEIIRDAGITSAFLHGGSSTMIAIGSPPDADAWAVSLGSDAESDSPRGVAMLADVALSVSSQDGDRPGHVIDPITETAASGARWAACIGDSAEATDAWSTALIVLGSRPPAMPERLTSLLRSSESDEAFALTTIGPGKSCIVSGVGGVPTSLTDPVCTGVHQ